MHPSSDAVEKRKSLKGENAVSEILPEWPIIEGSALIIFPNWSERRIITLPPPPTFHGNATQVPLDAIKSPSDVKVDRFKLLKFSFEGRPIGNMTSFDAFNYLLDTYIYSWL